jgi:putative nucleotidyltransferase with HDIG domain
VFQAKKARGTSAEANRMDKELVNVFAKTIEYKDEYTMDHSTRVADYSVEIAKQLQLQPIEIEVIYAAGILHDIGKIGVKDHILQKPGALTHEEWHEVREHVNLGVQILKGIGGFEGVTSMVADHHERWDGKGYPSGKQAEEITLGGRILAVADAYDAMTSQRIYRNPLSQEEAQQELKRYSNIQFDNQIVEAFIFVLSQEPRERL